MRLIKALLHLHSKQSPGKLNYKSFIRQTFSACILFQPFNVRLVFCPTRGYTPASAFLVQRLRGRQVTQSHFCCPWQPMALAKLSLLHLSSRLVFLLLLSAGGPLLLLSPLPPFRFKHSRVIHVKSIGDSLRKSMEPIDSLLSLW